VPTTAVPTTAVPTTTAGPTTTKAPGPTTTVGPTPTTTVGPTPTTAPPPTTVYPGTTTSTTTTAPPSPYTPVVCNCAQCPSGAAAQWTIGPIAGITAGADCPTGCPSFNGTWTLSQVDTCSWQVSVSPNGCGVGTPTTWGLQYSGGQWVLTADIGSFSVALVTYVPSGTFNCTGTTVFNFQSAGPYCTNWPATINVTPVGGGVVPSQCVACCPSNGVPNTVHATLNTVVGACIVPGQTFTLTYGGGIWLAHIGVDTLTMSCNSGSWSFSWTYSGAGGGSAAQNGADAGSTCNPLILNFSAFTVAGGCYPTSVTVMM
jgi:hypothetical protein